MAEDHLNTETSVSAEITETGVKAAAKSRTVASVDRLLGGAVDVGSAWLEGVAQRRRAKTEGELQFIQAAVKYGLDKMNVDDEFAKRAFEGHFKKVARQQLNKDAVVAEALEDLRTNPPSEQEAVTGPASVSDEFMDRFEYYAETATSDELRQRWGRVLSAEIRKPGTFGPKVLRATDELDAKTAAIFERMSASRMRVNALAKPLIGDLSFEDTAAVIGAGLIVDPGIVGHLSLFFDLKLNTGEDIWYFGGGSFGLGIKKSTQINYTENGSLANHNGTPAVQAYILTDVGHALCSILPANEFEVFRKLAIEIKKEVSGGEILYFKQQQNQIFGVPPELFFS
ncbi:DUF2806 domain-containing protein [Agrobacterium vitis]|uniref:DUF2806 domain-containing protein n=1 Tax=Agrobacterium vitis TaxID=373 RepID=UPI00157272C7|nr:DUF2806 domain-containing protein [Agrobacterium vitis]NSZ52961.1 DUF2806 domain-containing protein [Agrobacterium vitis]NTA31720.1 DUF2806 domain-containing protein [Agrobacterium vitis]